MTALLFQDNGSFKEVPAIKWLQANAKECQDIYIQEVGYWGEGSCKLRVLVSKYRTLETQQLSVDVAKELFSYSKFDHVAKHY